MEKVSIKFDYNNMMSEFVGRRGIKREEVAALSSKAQEAFYDVGRERGTGMLGWTELPYNQEDAVKDILSAAAQIRERFENFVVLGIGGSALGPTAVFTALCHFRYNDLPKEKRGGPRFFVEDNVDPERMNALLDVIDVEKTCFNVITKSGATSETMSQYLIISELLKEKLGDKYRDNIVATTSAKKGNLIKLAADEGFKTFYIPEGVGGRFSELCPVGLLPAAVLGIDIKSLLDGAAAMDEKCSSATCTKNPALMAAVLQYIAMEKKSANISVMMPYSDALKYFADWYCQLWGESLGKATDKRGEKVYAGQTPVKALGVTDQHSQVQLYVEGPFDKVITFIAVDKFRSDVTVPAGAEAFPDVNFLCGHTLQELINTERKATEYALTKAGRMNNAIILPEINAYTVGQLLMFFQLETAYCGALLNIDTFNQPGVEGGKNATYALFERAGYEAKKAEIDAAPKKNDKYII
ncbi:MAG: glucose-6-phosphate isomerase [Clostridiaceae bacterium]|jgi:glucose-6-phosphate isomerase|nr:glucose-6-phosphate isomerase [Clostridiaceae bacterium]